jgi:Flp pilus assembly protein TadG
LKIQKRNPHRDRSGIAALELTVILPFLAVCFSAAVDFGRVYNASQTLDQCAFAGAMYASGTAQTSQSTGTTAAGIAAACAAGVSLSPPLQSSNVTVTAGTGSVTVSIGYDFALFTPFLTSTGTVHLTRSAVLNTAPTPG